MSELTKETLDSWYEPRVYPISAEEEAELTLDKRREEAEQADREEEF